MTTASTFDALKAVRDLEAAGVERRQAEAHAEALRRAAGDDRADLATKADLSELRADLYRALWMQAAGIVGALAALAGIAVALASLLGGAGR